MAPSTSVLKWFGVDKIHGFFFSRRRSRVVVVGQIRKQKLSPPAWKSLAITQLPYYRRTRGGLDEKGEGENNVGKFLTSQKQQIAGCLTLIKFRILPEINIVNKFGRKIPIFIISL